MTTRAASATRPTESAENYLKAVYAVERGGVRAATGELAVRLGVAPSSVTGMLRRLGERGLLTVESRRGAQLTAAGRRVALRTLRRHRVLEAYLASVLGYSWDGVHVEAERLEHAVSDELIERMAAAMGHPTVDPHGAPIPAADGTVDETEHASLVDLPVGQHARVVRVVSADPAMLRYLHDLGVRPCVDVVVVARAASDGPITILVRGHSRLLVPAVAGRVLIDPSVR